MLDDFTPIVHQLDGRPIKVWAVGDVHIGARECNMEGFERFIGRIAQDCDSYLVILGDILSNGIRDSLTSVYEETMPPSLQKECAARLLEPVKGRILGAVGGNHEYRSVKAVDLDPLYDVMVMLGIQELYRQNFAFVRVNLRRGATRESYALYLTHGKSAGKQRRFAQSAIEGVDAILCGHTHSGLVEKSARLVLTTQNNVTVKQCISLTAASWLDYGGYAARGQMLPTATCDPQALLLDFTGSNGVPGKVSVIW